MFGIAHYYFFSVFIKSIGTGYLIGFVYLLFSVFRKCGGGNTFAVAASDIIFCLVAAVLHFVFLLDANAGVHRSFILAGEAIGFFVFLFLPGKSFSAKTRKLTMNAKDRFYRAYVKMKNRITRFSGKKKSSDRCKKTEKNYCKNNNN